MRLYSRKVQVVIGDDNTNISAYIRASNSIITIPEDISVPLRINFSVSLNQASALPSDNFIKIYNLNDNSQSYIKQKGVRVRLLAGYDENIAIIYDGTIDKVEIERKDVDVITTIILASKTFDITGATFSKSYAGLISTTKIVEDALSEYTSDGISYQYINLIPEFLHFNFCFDGRVKDLLDKLLSPLGVLWYIDGTIIKFSIDGKSNGITTQVLSKNTGMLYSPIKTDKGVNVKSLLNNRLIIGDDVKIESSYLSTTIDNRSDKQSNIETQGVYKIMSIKHHGDNINGNFLTEIEAVANE